MPELPEVETTRAGIEPHVRGQVVRTVVVRQGQLRWPVSAALARVLPGQTIHGVARRGKYLLFAAETGHVCLHLGMSGRLRIVPANTPPAVHDHVDIVLENESAVRFNDARRFGSIFWLTGEPRDFSLLARLGPEPLSAAFNGAWLKTRATNRRAPVKAFIMDSATVVGVGNIYACEALHAARIHPRRPAARVSQARYSRLAQAIKQTLSEAIAAGGTTLRDYIGVDGQTGYFQLTLAVYGRAGAPCPRDGAPIKREVIGNRSTFFCAACQR
jgi:formamidopyrimidine-DNA glycosylase